MDVQMADKKQTNEPSQVPPGEMPRIRPLFLNRDQTEALNIHIGQGMREAWEARDRRCGALSTNGVDQTTHIRNWVIAWMPWFNDVALGHHRAWSAILEDAKIRPASTAEIDDVCEQYEPYRKMCVDINRELCIEAVDSSINPDYVKSFTSHFPNIASTAFCVKLIEPLRAKLLVRILEPAGDGDAEGNGQQSPSIEPKKAKKPPVKDRAEAKVKKLGGVFPGVNDLAKMIKCSPGTLSELINGHKSTYLEARKAEYDANRKGAPQTLQLTSMTLDNISQSTEDGPQEAAGKPESLDDLIADQGDAIKWERRGRIRP
jgi:hypothetical protein